MVEKFNIIQTINVHGKDTYLLNKPFELLLEEPDFERGRISSYHQPEEFKAEWWRYDTYIICDICITSATEKYSLEEALLFTAMNNGVSMSRDNLFSMYALYNRFIKLKELGDVTILALTTPEILPKHLSYTDRKICPSLEIERKENKGNNITNRIDLNYDWSWIDEEFHPNNLFAFLRPMIRKNLF